jgi:hypothetical protein
MVFKLIKSAEQCWRKLKGAPGLAQVVQGVHFNDGLQEEDTYRIAPSFLYTTFAINSNHVRRKLNKIC